MWLSLHSLAFTAFSWAGLLTSRWSIPRSLTSKGRPICIWQQLCRCVQLIKIRWNVAGITVTFRIRHICCRWTLEIFGSLVFKLSIWGRFFLTHGHSWRGQVTCSGCCRCVLMRCFKHCTHSLQNSKIPLIKCCLFFYFTLLGWWLCLLFCCDGCDGVYFQ